MLEMLEDERIFSVYSEGDKFVIGEECDGYFKVRCTADQLRQLAAELLALADAPRSERQGGEGK